MCHRLLFNIYYVHQNEPRGDQGKASDFGVDEQRKARGARVQMNNSRKGGVELTEPGEGEGKEYISGDERLRRPPG